MLGHKDDMDVEEGEYRRRKGDSDSEDDRDGKKDRQRTSKKDAIDAEKPLEELSPEDEEARMMALMGFGGFDSTKVQRSKLTSCNASMSHCLLLITYPLSTLAF